jgi:hypothetical protein
MISIGMRIPGTPVMVRDYLFRREHRHPAAQCGGLSLLGAFVTGALLVWLVMR